MANEDEVAAEAKAKSRFILMSLMRLGGALMVAAGIAVLQQVLPLPSWTAYLLIALGLVELLIIPQMLARMWRSDGPTPPG